MGQDLRVSSYKQERLPRANESMRDAIEAKNSLAIKSLSRMQLTPSSRISSSQSAVLLTRIYFYEVRRQRYQICFPHFITIRQENAASFQHICSRCLSSACLIRLTSSVRLSLRPFLFRRSWKRALHPLARRLPRHHRQRGNPHEAPLVCLSKRER